MMTFYHAPEVEKLRHAGIDIVEWQEWQSRILRSGLSYAEINDLAAGAIVHMVPTIEDERRDHWYMQEIQNDLEPLIDDLEQAVISANNNIEMPPVRLVRFNLVGLTTFEAYPGAAASISGAARAIVSVFALMLWRDTGEYNLDHGAGEILNAVGGDLDDTLLQQYYAYDGDEGIERSDHWLILLTEELGEVAEVASNFVWNVTRNSWTRASRG